MGKRKSINRKQVQNTSNLAHLSNIELRCSNIYTQRIRNGEIRMMQFIDGEIRIIKDDVLVF